MLFYWEQNLLRDTNTRTVCKTGIKCDELDFGELIERHGIVRMPRLSATYWIRIEKENALSVLEWKHCIKKSYDLIIAGLPKKIKQPLTQPKQFIKQ